MEADQHKHFSLSLSLSLSLTVSSPPRLVRRSPPVCPALPPVSLLNPHQNTRHQLNARYPSLPSRIAPPSYPLQRKIIKDYMTTSTSIHNLCYYEVFELPLVIKNTCLASLTHTCLAHPSPTLPAWLTTLPSTPSFNPSPTPSCPTLPVCPYYYYHGFTGGKSNLG